MQVNKTEFKAICVVLDWFMKKPKFRNLMNNEEHEQFSEVCEAMRSIIVRHEKNNARTWEQIKVRREADKNYARKKKGETA